VVSGEVFLARMKCCAGTAFPSTYVIDPGSADKLLEHNLASAHLRFQRSRMCRAGGMSRSHAEGLVQDR
jgi:hypothetical protein